MKKHRLLLAGASLLLFGGTTYVSQALTPQQTVWAENAASQLETYFKEVNLSQSQRAFIERVFESAKRSERDDHILTSVTLAQAIIESNWGTSSLGAAPNYNLFGIKADQTWTGDVFSKKTSEFVDNAYTTVMADFRAYDSHEASVYDHGKFFTSTAYRRERYQAFLNASNYQEAVQKLGESGYATSPTYGQTLLTTIQTYQLDKLDGHLDADSQAIGERVRPYTVTLQANSGQFSIDDKPWGTAGANFVRDAADLNGAEVTIYERWGDYAKISQDGKTIGWVDRRAVQRQGLIANELYVNDQLQTDWNGLRQYEGQWYLFNRGVVETSQNSLYLYNGTWYKLNRGRVDWSYTGLVDYYGTTYYVQNGQLNWGITGLTNINGTWYNLSNSAVNKTEKTLVKYNGTWYAVLKGKIDWSYTGFVDYYGTTYYLENAQLTWGRNGLVQVDGTWYTLQNSAKVDVGESLVLYNGTWFYVNHGQVEWGKNTLVNYYGTWYAVRDSKVDWSFNGLIDYYGTTYFIQGGKLNWSLNGLVQANSGTWYHIVNGRLAAYNAVVNHNGASYYVQAGVLNWGLDGLYEAQGVTYYLDNSTVVRDGETLVQKNGTWYYVNNGVQEPNKYTLVLYNGTWYAVRNSIVDWSFEGIVPYNGKKYYIKNGQLTWGISGPVNINGEWFDLDNSMVKHTVSIILDPGHGGKDSGAVARSNGVMEKTQALKVGQLVEQKLKAKDYNVLMTRKDDTFVDLIPRSQQANGSDADIFVSLHFNSSVATGQNGIETYWYEYDPDYQPKINKEKHNDPERLANSEKLAIEMQRQLVAFTGAYDRGVKRNTFSVLRETAVPAVLLEMGFLSNPNEASLIKQDAYLEKLANAIVAAIDNYFQNR